jgi:hypothetical protein
MDNNPIQSELDNFIHHINEIENIDNLYQIEDFGNESQEQEYIMYIQEHCQKLKELIIKLYEIKLEKK